MKKITSFTFLYELNISTKKTSDYGSINYREIVLSKTKLNKIFLSLNKEIVLLDIDIFFFRNPFGYIFNHKEDLVISQDGKHIVNTGL